MPISLDKAIQSQRDHLTQLLSVSLLPLTQKLASVIHDKAQLETCLINAYTSLPFCKYLYVLDEKGVQLTANIKKIGKDDSQYQRNRASRPYMQIMFSNIDFRLSESYISRNQKRPSLTAVHTIQSTYGVRIGFLGVDYDLRELPRTEKLYEQTHQWQQIKGDPAIRGGLFAQQRVQSQMDEKIDDVLSILEELILQHGFFHGKIHFSSNRFTLWHVDDPYDYHILTMETLNDPDVCLAYPQRPYFQRAIVPSLKIIEVFKQFRVLRLADETVYLRSGSLNIVNGMVGLNFSCDGTHYIPYDEFLEKGLEFWFGA
jgi:hypothetical protein